MFLMKLFSKSFDLKTGAAGERKPGPLSYRAQPVNKGPDGHAEVAPGPEMGKCTTTAQTRINTGVFVVVQVYKNRRKRTRIEREAYKNGVYLYTPTTTESRINTGFFLYLYTFGFQVGGCTRTQFPCCCRAGKLPFGGNFGKPLDNRPGRVYNNTSVKQSGAGGSHPCSPV